MSKFVLSRSMMVVGIIIASAVLAIGCGGNKSGASDSVTSAKGLDYVPADALLYFVVDTDFEGSSWKQADQHLTALSDDYEGLDKELEGMFSEEDVDYEADLKPWLGESFGVAMLSAENEDEFSWWDVEDREAAETFLKNRGAETAGSEDDFTIWDYQEKSEGDDDKYAALSDDLMLVAGDQAQLKTLINNAGDNTILDNDEIKDIADSVEGDSVLALVVNGDAVAKAASENPMAAQLGLSDQLKKLDGMSLSVTAENDGFGVHGVVALDESVEADSLPKNYEATVFNSLSETSFFAIGAPNVGSRIEMLLDAVGSSNPDLAKTIGQGEALVGIDRSQLADGMKGETALSVSADEDSLAEMLQLLSSQSPQLFEKGQLTLATESTGSETSELFERLLGVVKFRATAEPQTSEQGDFDVTTLEAQGVMVEHGSSDELEMLAFGEGGVANFDDSDLSDNDAFTEAWDLSDGPEEVTGIMFADLHRILAATGNDSVNVDTFAGLVGWTETDDNDVVFNAFLHVKS